MSWTIPNKIEADIQSGIAEYRTFQTGMGGQTVLQVPPNAYIVIFGMDYAPSGGGYYESQIQPNAAFRASFTDSGRFMTQQVSFYTGNQFYPFIFRVPFSIGGVAPGALAAQVIVVGGLEASSIARSLYIPSSKDVSITVGVIRNVSRNTAAAIPVSETTPADLTYGGNAQTMNVQTDFSTGAPQTLQFLQPNPQLFDSLGFGLAPAGQSDQAFAKPNAANGLQDATNVIAGYGGALVNQANMNYFLCLHYALYNSAPDEKFI